MRDRKKSYQRMIGYALFFNILAIIAVYIWVTWKQVPNEIMMFVGEEESLEFNTPAVGVFSGAHPALNSNIQFDFTEPFSLKIDNKGTYSMSVRLFGLFWLKDMDVNVVEQQSLIPGGENIGIYVETKGIMVLGNGTVTGMDGLEYQPSEHIIKTGDYIVAVNGTDVEEIDEMIELVDCCKGDAVSLSIIRNEQEQTIRVSPVKTGKDEYKLGIWVREDTQGLGTLTYRTMEGGFGALGHGITDSDTGLLMKIDNGNIFDTEIIDIIKGKQGQPGEVVGIIRSSESRKMGDISKNTECGVFGSVEENQALWRRKEAIPVGLKQEVEKGPATILCQLDEGEPRSYTVEIEKIKWNTGVDSKGMVIRITDERLLEKTNGIVQGMSGSPILQNGKIIGAVTHVFIQDSTKGYGIFIENMLKK